VEQDIGGACHTHPAGAGAGRARRAGVAALLGALSVGLAAGPAAGDPSSDKRRVDQQLAQVRARYEGADAAVRGAMQAYAAAAAELPAATARLADARGSVAARQADAGQAHRDVLAAAVAQRAADQRAGQAAARVQAARAEVSGLVTAAYKGSGLLALAALVAARSPAELADRIGYIDQVARGRRAALDQFLVARSVAGTDLAVAADARRRAEVAERAVGQALAAALAAQARAEQAQGEVATLVHRRAAAVRIADAHRAEVLARYRALRAESDRITAQLRAFGARDRRRGGSGPATGGPGAALALPIHGVKTSDFGMRYDPYYHVWQLHAGVDLAAPGGTPIHAAAAGRVVRAGWDGGYGNYTCLYHGAYRGSGVSTCYGHQSRILVRTGEWVARGQTIGLVGSTGAATGAHLHFEVRLDGRPVQPLDWLPACLC
jgi:murein DD-endopeptidase MepM/ murein hydrolase activator NlpD